MEKKRNIASICPLLCAVLIAVLMLFGTGTSSSSGTTESSPENSTAQTTPNQSPQVTNIPTDMVVLGEGAVALTDCEKNRFNNISLAAQSINGTEVGPNQSFSFNSCVGDTTTDSRYKESGTIVDDQIVQVRGGGICIVSSLVYKAALESGMEITERHAHTMLQDYIAMGLDATVAYGKLDFCFKNTSSNSIIIQANVSENAIRIRIYGKNDNPDISYEAASQVMNTYTETDEAGERVYYEVNSYLLTYQKGQLINKELLATDTYLAKTNSLPSVSEKSSNKG